MYRKRKTSSQNHNSELTEDRVSIRKLCVNNFTGTTTESDLRTVFEKYGTVEEILIDNKNAKTNKVCAFVTFADTKSSIQAQEENITLKRRRLMVRPVDSCYQTDLERPTSAQSVIESEINDTESLLLLNDDCLLKIFSRLELIDLLTMGKTCWRMKNVVEMIYKTKKELDLSNQTSKITIQNVRNILKAFGPYLTHFKVSCSSFYDRNDLLLTMVAKYCKNLTALSLDDFNVNCRIKNLHLLLKNLKKLDLICCRISDRHLSMLIEKSGCNRLEEITLYLNFEITGSCLSHFKNLKVANLSRCVNIQPEYLIRFFDQNTTLEDLNIMSCYKVNIQCITAIASKLTNLKKLHLCNTYEGVNPSNYIPLAELPCLIHLQFNFRGYVSVEALLLKLSEKNQLEYLDISNGYTKLGTIKALENMTKLKVLKANYISNVDDETLKLISKNKDLEELEIVGWKVSNDGLIDLVKNCKHIRRMDIYGCLGINNSFILDLKEIVEGRPQVLTLIVGHTQIEKTIYSDNLLKPNKFIKLDYGK